jgi:hypothetical protein
MIELGRNLLRRIRAGAVRRRAWLRIALGLASAFALAAIVTGYGLQPSRVSLVSGDRSPVTIHAPHTISYVDEAATAQLRARAEQWVVPVLVVRPEAIAHAQDEVSERFGVLAASRQNLPHLRRAFPNVAPEVLAWAHAQPPGRLMALVDPAADIVLRTMSRPIPDETPAVEAARRSAREAANKLPLAAPARELVSAIAESCIRPNRSENVEATKELRVAARRAVPPVRKNIVGGEVVVAKGKIVTREDLQALRALGLLRPAPDPWQIAAIVALCALAVVGLAGYLRRQQPEIYADTRLLLLTALIAVLALFAVNLVSLQGPRAELLSMLSITAGVMIIAVLVGDRVALMVAVAESLLVGIMAQGQLSLALLTFGSSLTGLLLARHIWPPSRLVAASLILGAINAGLVIVVTRVTGGDQIIGPAWHALLYGFGAPSVAVGAIFLLQRPFDVTTHLRLIELANPNEPLLRRMLVEAPGTYSDSFLVANLAEAAADAIGANGLLARVGSYYHDIGKLRRPYVFAENQALLGIDNLHDQLSPSLSSLVVSAHVRDGVDLAQQYRLPTVIRDIIAQHHGTTLISFFYQQARSGPRGENLPEEGFRYPGPRPRTREAAIVMLADAAFAAVWSLSEKTVARVEAVVRQIVRERLEDGQLDESSLTLRDLSAIIDSFLRLLKGIIFHTRVEYPQLARAAQGRTRRPSDARAPGAYD